MKHTRLGCLIVLICGIAAGQPARGDGGWLTQSIPIQEGWNLVWVGIDPIPGIRTRCCSRSTTQASGRSFRVERSTIPANG
jgi:hypothetical protein